MDAPHRFCHGRLAAIAIWPLLAVNGGCSVISVAGSAAGTAISVAGSAASTAISVTGSVVSTGVQVTGKAIEKTFDAAARPK